MFDLKVVNCNIVDGSGKDSYYGDIGIRNDKIVAIGDLKDIKSIEKIDAKNNIVCPGFIDVHSHSDYKLITNPKSEKKIKQGITTEIIGNCGISLIPRSHKYEEEMKLYTKPILNNNKSDWKCESLSDYYNLLEKQGTNVNVASYVGHGMVRLSVMGFENRPPKNKELEEMKQLVKQAMQDGALGITTGLIYAPGTYANNKEIKEICKVVSEYGGIYNSHMRSESDNVVKSLKETISFAKDLDMTVNISHHKITAPEYWGSSVETLLLITQARLDGLKVTCDQYPYKAGSTTASALFPPWSLENGIDGLLDKLKNKDIREKIKQDFINGISDWQCIVKDIGWDNIIISGVNYESNVDLQNKSILSAAIGNNSDPDEFLFNLMLEEDGIITIIAHQQLEEDLQRIMKYPFTMFGTDGIYGDNPHPRLTNTFPRIIGKYVRDKNVLRLEESIRKMTSLSARTLGLKNIGLIKKGYNADIVIFDFNEITDNGTYIEPNKSPKGIEYVIVNGKIVMEKDKVSNILSGKIIRK